MVLLLQVNGTVGVNLSIFKANARTKPVLFIKPFTTAQTDNKLWKQSPILLIAAITFANGVNVSEMLLDAFDNPSATFNHEPLVIVIPAIVSELTFKTFKLLFGSIIV